MGDVESELLLAAFFGALGVMALFHLGLAAVLRESIHALFAAYLAAFSVSCYVWELDWAATTEYQPGVWQQSGRALADALAALVAIQFVRAYLGTPQFIPRFDRALTALAVLALGVAVVAGAGYGPLALQGSAFLSLAGSLALLAAAVLCWRRGYGPARYLLLATGAHWVAVFLATVLSYVTWSPATVLGIADAGYYGSSVFMVLLFSLGLADRYSTERRRREQVEAEKQAIETLSYRDGLTGVWNRRRLDEEFAREWKRAARQGESLAMILIDVDCFKKYNDHYGHRAGDECLRQVARALAETAARPADLVARYGGEEFAVLVPDSELEQAVQLAESMRRAVAVLELEHAQSTAAPYITVSVGVAACVPEFGPESQLIEAADRCLYEAKRSGRNRVAAEQAVGV